MEAPPLPELSLDHLRCNGLRPVAGSSEFSVTRRQGADASVLPEIECCEAGGFVFTDDLMTKSAIP